MTKYQIRIQEQQDLLDRCEKTILKGFSKESDKLLADIKKNRDSWSMGKSRTTDEAKRKFIEERRTKFHIIHKMGYGCIEATTIVDELRQKEMYSVNTVKNDILSSMMRLYRKMYDLTD